MPKMTLKLIKVSIPSKLCRIIVEYEKGAGILKEIFINIIEVLLLGFSITYLFCQTHTLRYSYKKTYLLFYLGYAFFFLASLPFLEYYLIWVLYFFVSLFIVSHLCFKDVFKKRLMMIGIFALIFVVEEMATTALSYILFRWLWNGTYVTSSYLIFKLCVKNIQMILYCFAVEKVLEGQLNHLKQFYVIPLGQGVMLILLYYLGVVECYTILGYILVILTLLILWSDYVLYQGFLMTRDEKISDIKYIQGQAFTKREAYIKKMNHDLLNHYLVLETLIEESREEEIHDYIYKMKDIYKEVKEDDD